MNDTEGFLARWSRRKRAAAVAPPQAEPAPAARTEPPPAMAGAPEAPPEFDPASLPPIESLTAESDISVFLRPQVPAALRTAALRRVWTLDPAIRDYVGPADYAWDYNAPDGIPGFSLELGGNVKRLLAQAIGLVEEEEKPAVAAEAAPEATSGPAPVLPPPPAAVAEAAPATAPDPSEARSEEHSGEHREERPEAPAAPPPRRHGSARPA